MDDREALKAELARLGSVTDLGFEAGGEAVERIKALAAALEALNPTTAPAREPDLLRGRWRLLYSSFGLQRDATLARLSFNLLPKTPVRVETLWQEVEPESGLYDNVVEYSAPGGERGGQVTLGRFAVASDQRLDVVFEAAQATGHPRVPLDNAKLPPLWSDVTYLDDDFRLNRGSFGSLYVLALDSRIPAGWSRDRG